MNADVARICALLQVPTLLEDDAQFLEGRKKKVQQVVEEARNSLTGELERINGAASSAAHEQHCLHVHAGSPVVVEHAHEGLLCTAGQASRNLRRSSAHRRPSIRM